MSEACPYICGCVVVTIIILMIAILPFIFVTTEDTERAVVYSKIFATFDDELIENGGFHTKKYNADVIRWPRTEETIEFVNGADSSDSGNLRPSITCNSNDGLLIDLHISFQFFPDQEKLLALTKEYRDHDNWKNLMVNQAESTIRNVCGDFIADQYQTERGAIALKMETEVKDETAARFSSVLTKLQLRDVQRPSQFESAIRDKENARSEIRLAENEEDQAVIRAQTKVDIAQEEKIRLLDTANTTAQIRLAQANNQREGILDRFIQLGNVYRDVQSRGNLTTQGILTYISNEIFMSDVTIAVEAPVKLSFRTEL